MKYLITWDVSEMWHSKYEMLPKHDVQNMKCFGKRDVQNMEYFKNVMLKIWNFLKMWCEKHEKILKRDVQNIRYFKIVT